MTKVDRAAMSVSLETRVPFLDHEIYQFAWSLPYEMKFHKGEGKRVLKNILYKYADQEIFERPKMGFGVPVGEWIKGPLRDWAEELAQPKFTASIGVKLLPYFPPIVPRIPEIDFINVMLQRYN